MISVLAGGVGAARLLAGMVHATDPTSITVVVNTADDAVVHGLYVSPDIDTVVYTLSGRSNPETGWGLANETWRAMEMLELLGGETWFRLGDCDLGTHLFRTGRMATGRSLSEVTAEMVAALGVATKVLPMSDDPVRTLVSIVEDDPSAVSPGGSSTTEIGFQDYFVRLRHSVPVASVRFDGAESAQPAPGVIDALETADTIVVCPSNPIVSIGPIRALEGIETALRARRESTVAISPIVAGRALKGPADRLMAELGHEASVVGVARLYSPIAATLVVDEADAELADAVEETGMDCIVAPTVMGSVEDATRLSKVVLSIDR